MSSRLRSLAIAACIVSCAARAFAANDWQVVKVGGRDYLTIENVAKFYGLPTGVQPGGPQGKTINLDNGRIELAVTLESREAIINGVRNWLCFPVLAKDGQYLLSRIDLAKTIEPQLRPQMIQNLGRFDTVVIDPGHGGHDKGACSAYGCEKDYVLDVARQLKPLLEAKGLKVRMTRDSDVFIPLETRANIANATPNCIFVSLHLNATDWNPAAAGFEIYSLTPRGAPSTQDNALALRFFEMQVGSPADAPSLALSMSVYHSIVGHLSEFDRGIKRARFAVLRRTRVPAILVEGGFLTERNEGRLIADSQWRAKYAQSLATGIENYKLLVDKRQRPLMVADYHRQLSGTLIARDATQPTPPPEAAAVIPASNTQGRTATNNPEEVAPANSPSMASEPSHEEAGAEQEAVPNADAPNTQNSPPQPVEEQMPDNVPSAPAPSPQIEPPAPSRPAPTDNRKAAMESETLTQRILRWVPAVQHLIP